MLNFLESKELPVDDSIAQCYDGFPNMQSHVALLILEKAPKAAVAYYS